MSVTHWGLCTWGWFSSSPPFPVIIHWGLPVNQTSYWKSWGGGNYRQNECEEMLKIGSRWKLQWYSFYCAFKFTVNIVSKIKSGGDKRRAGMKPSHRETGGSCSHCSLKSEVLGSSLHSVVTVSLGNVPHLLSLRFLLFKYGNLNTKYLFPVALCQGFSASVLLTFGLDKPFL